MEGSSCSFILCSTVQEWLLFKHLDFDFFCLRVSKMLPTSCTFLAASIMPCKLPNSFKAWVYVQVKVNLKHSTELQGSSGHCRAGTWEAFQKILTGLLEFTLWSRNTSRNKKLCIDINCKLPLCAREQMGSKQEGTKVKVLGTGEAREFREPWVFSSFLQMFLPLCSFS